MSKLALSFCCLCITLFACQQEQESARVVQADEDPNSLSAMVNIPLDEDGNVDESRVARIVFDSMVYDFGTAQEGDVVDRNFSFTNTGAVALVIYDAKSSCGCTVPEIPKEPVPPGERGVLGVKFNTAAKPGSQSKTVTVIANTYPSETKVVLKGEVIPQPK